MMRLKERNADARTVQAKESNIANFNSTLLFILFCRKIEFCLEYLFYSSLGFLSSEAV